MYLGLGLILTAVGAVLRFGVSNSGGDGINLDTIGLILMIVGVIMAVIALLLQLRGNRSTVTQQNADGTVTTQSRQHHNASL